MNVCEQKKTHPEGIKHPPVGEVLASPGKPEAVRQAPKSCVATLTRNSNGETKSVFKGISARTPPWHLLRKGECDKRQTQRTWAVLLHLVSRTLGAGDTFAYLHSHDVTSKCSWEKTSQRSVTSPNAATSAVTCPSSVVFPVTRREGTQGDEEDEDGAQDGEATPAASGHVTGWPHRAGWRTAAFRADWVLWPTRTRRQLPSPVLRSPSGPPSLPPLCFPVLRVLFGAHGPPLTKPGEESRK